VRSFLLDTSAILHFTRSNSPVAQQIELDYGVSLSAFRPSICVITLGEIEAFAQSWGAKRIAAARTVLQSFATIDINHGEVIDAYGALHSENKARGSGVGQNDLWIAATAMATGLTLISADRDFLKLVTAPDMVVVNAKTGLTERKTF
jgi:tRNA(fMet)-specific endonuclease VapC